MPQSHQQDSVNARNAGAPHDELPEGWLFCSLGDVVDYGKTSKAEPAEIEPTGWILELEDIEKDTSKLLDRRTFADRQSKSTKNRFEAGDVLYGKLRPYLNKVIIADQPGYCTTEIIPLKPNSALNGRYLFSWLKHPVFLDYVSHVSHGLNMPRLGTESGKAAPFVLAPLAEQKRIADKLEVVLGRVDACRARLDRVPTLLKRFRQSVLAAATSGKLTEDWREGRSTIAWKSLKVSDVGSVQLGRQRAPKYHRGDNMRPYLRVQNVFEARLDLSDVMEMEFSDADYRRYKLSYGDILLNEGQSPQYLGRPAMFRDELPGACFTNSLIRFRAKLDILDREYALLVFRHYMRSGRFAKEGSITTNIAHLSAGKFANIEFSLPPLPEQQEIIRRVEALFAFADRIEARLAITQKTVERLTPATLAKAFRGELVPQDPNDEPAADLLQRMRVASGTQPTPKSRRTASK